MINLQFPGDQVHPAEFSSPH